MRRLRADVWIALVLIAVCGFMLNDLLGTEGSGAYVKTTTLPTALVIVLMLLSVVMLGGALFRPAEIRSEPGSQAFSGAGLLRVTGMVVWVAAFIAAMPWLGYLFASVIFLVGANLLYGNRNPYSIIAIAVIVPVALLLFFEKFMIVLLPSSRLFG